MKNDEIALALEAFKNDKLVAIPTETVYGLAAPLNQPKLIKKIFELKERPFFDPLIVHGSNLEQLKPLVKEWTPLCDHLASIFWPGPLTMVMNKTELVDDMITAGLDTVGIRIPNSELTISFLEQLGIPVAAPSANMFKKVSPTKAADVSQVFNEKDVFVLDGGESQVGIESTIIKLTKKSIQILRPGMISKAQLKESLTDFDCTIVDYAGENIVAPGQLKEHYRPEKEVITIFADTIDEANEILQKNTISEACFIDLDDNPTLVARSLYKSLREASQGSHQAIAVCLPKDTQNDDSWSGILDRLIKASAKVLTKD